MFLSSTMKMTKALSAAFGAATAVGINVMAAAATRNGSISSCSGGRTCGNGCDDDVSDGVWAGVWLRGTARRRNCDVFVLTSLWRREDGRAGARINEEILELYMFG